MTPEQYLEALANLNVGRSAGHPKPHKPCLLLAVLDLIEQGAIDRNRIHFNEALRMRFTYHFDQWRQGNDTNNPDRPFYHLKTDGFWHHKPKKGREVDYEALSNSLTARKLKDAVEYAYLDDALFKLFNDPILRPEIRSALVSNMQNRRDQFEAYMVSLGKSEKTISNYSGALNRSLATLLSEHGSPVSSLFDIGSVHEYEIKSKTLAELEAFKVKDTTGNGMYRAALRAYGEFLKDSADYEVQQDLEAINQDVTLSQTQKRVMQNARLGQGKFRAGLMSYWNGCAVTGYPSLGLLVASHIKPWKEAGPAERLDHFNGLLLLPNLDKVFDRQLISFDAKGRILVSKHLEDPVRLGIHAEMRVERLTVEHQNYLAFHREGYQERLTAS